MNAPAFHTIEPLEARIAPAAIFKYTDTDGDLVKITASKGNSTDLGDLVKLHSVLVGGIGYQVQEIDLTDAMITTPGEFNGASLSIVVTKKAAAGDGRVNIGWINAPGLDLGTVTVQGDLGRIDAGTDSAKVPAVAALNLATFGGQGTTTQAGGGSLESDIKGRLGSLTVTKGDMLGVWLNDTGLHGYIGNISLFALVGQNTNNSGMISAVQGIGAVKIAHNLAGGGTAGQQRSGYILSGGKIASVQIGGSIVGDAADYSGAIFAEEGIGPVAVKRDVLGGSGDYSGAIFTSFGAGTPIGQITIGGSLTAATLTTQAHTAYISTGTLAGVTIGGEFDGGSGTLDGAIETAGDMGPVKILGAGMIAYRGTKSAFISSGGKIASVLINGDLRGGELTSESGAGEIFSTGDMGPVTIKGNIFGGAGADDGLVDSHGKLKSVTIGSSIIGGTGSDSGEIYSVGDMGPVSIDTTIIGSATNGSGQYNGYVGTLSNLASIKIGKDLLGGAATDSGEIYAGKNIGAIKIGQNFTAESYSGSTAIGDSAAIRAGGRIGSLFIGGSFTVGPSAVNKTTDCGVIHAGQDIGSLSVKGAVIGSTSGFVKFDAIITAVGQAKHGKTTDLAIGSIHIGDLVSNADILAGYDASLTPTNAEAQIGAVTVGSNWVASNLVAGVKNAGFNFGTGNDHFITAMPAIIPKIASITIGGVVTGSGGAGEHFGFVAGSIGSFKTKGKPVALTPGAGNDTIPLDTTGTNNVSIHEANS